MVPDSCIRVDRRAAFTDAKISCMTTSWRIAPGVDPALRAWGDEYVVHHALSNDTHRLSARAGQLLLKLACSADAGVCDDGALTLVDEETLAVLEALSELGFVTQC